MDYDIETVCCPSRLGNRLTGEWVRMSQKDRDTHEGKKSLRSIWLNMGHLCVRYYFRIYILMVIF